MTIQPYSNYNTYLESKYTGSACKTATQHVPIQIVHGRVKWRIDMEKVTMGSTSLLGQRKESCVSVSSESNHIIGVSVYAR